MTPTSFRLLISANPAGWDFMVHGGNTGFGNFAYTSGGGVLYFSGFWSLVVELAVTTGVVLFLLMSVCSVIAGELGQRVL